MSANVNPKHVEEDDIDDIYATHFQFTGTDQEVVLGLGTLDLSVTEQGTATDPEIRYHSKIRMSPETAQQLYALLREQFEDQDGAEQVAPGVQ